MLNRPDTQVTEDTSQYWQIQRLRDSTVLCYNLPPLLTDGKNHRSLDARFVSTRYTLYGASLDRRQPISDFLISRHWERLKNEEIVAFFCTAQYGVTEQLRSWFKAAKIDLFESHPNQDHESTMFALLVPIADFHKIQAIVYCLASHMPLPDNFYQALDAIGHAPWQAPTHLPINSDYSPIYFKNLDTVLFFGGHYQEFLAIHADFPTRMPEIHELVLTNNVERIKDLLKINPQYAIQPDPWGVNAYSLAHRIGNVALVKIFLAAMNQYSNETVTYKNTIHNLSRLRDKPDDKTLPADEKKIAEYRALYEKPVPQRPLLHQAVINNDIETAKQMIIANPTLIDQADPWGFTVTTIAAAKNQVALLDWLLKHGASTKDTRHWCPFKSMNTIRAIDNAKSVAVLRLLLNFKVDPARARYHLTHAIIRNDIPFAECLLHYLYQFEDYRGLSMLELATKYVSMHGTELLKMLLLVHKDFVPQGPYDTWFPPEAESLYLQHNQRITKQKARAGNALQLITELVQDNCIKTIFKNKEVTVVAELKPLQELGADKDAIKVLYHKNYTYADSESHEAADELLENELALQPERKQFIHLSRLNGKVIAFLIFELIPGHHSLIGNFIQFHAKLAANDPAHSDLGLIKLALRTRFAVADNSKDPVYLYAETLFPGTGLSLVVPPQSEYSPLYYIHPDIIQYMAQRVNVKVENGLIATQFATRARPTQERDLTFRFFRSVGGNISHAVAVGAPVNKDVEEKYLKSIECHGYTKASLETHYNNWRFYIGLTQQVSEEARATPEPTQSRLRARL